VPPWPGQECQTCTGNDVSHTHTHTHTANEAHMYCTILACPPRRSSSCRVICPGRDALLLLPTTAAAALGAVTAGSSPTCLGGRPPSPTRPGVVDHSAGMLASREPRLLTRDSKKVIPGPQRSGRGTAPSNATLYLHTSPNPGGGGFGRRRFVVDSRGRGSHGRARQVPERAPASAPAGCPATHQWWTDLCLLQNALR